MIRLLVNGIRPDWSTPDWSTSGQGWPIRRSFLGFSCLPKAVKAELGARVPARLWGELNLGPRLDNGEARIGGAEGEWVTVNDG